MSLIISCKKKVEQEVDPTLAKDTLKVTYTPLQTTPTTLSSGALEAIEGWEGYMTLADALSTIKEDNYRQLEESSKDWIEKSILLYKETPDSIATPAIKSRLSVLMTRTSTFNQELSKRAPDTALVNKEATELFNAFQDLNLQLNLKFQKSVDELLKEYRVEAEELNPSDTLDLPRSIQQLDTL